MSEESTSRELGRPSLYNAELQAKADEYIFEFEKQGDVIPSHAGLACWLGLAKSTLYEWKKTYPAFSVTLEAIQSKQEVIAVNKGLAGIFNSTITKLVLANHGYSDKQEIEHHGRIDSKVSREMTDSELEEMIAARNARNT